MCAAIFRIVLVGALILIAPFAGAAPSPSSAAALARLRGEPDDTFARRALQLGDADANVLATTWNGFPTLFVDYVRGADTEAPERPLIALMETAPGAYRKLQVTVGETEGGEPDIAAIGFANADRDPAKELIVVLVWRQLHYDACGPVYEVRLVDDAGKDGTTLHALPLSKHFGSGCIESPRRYRFTTIAAVKRELGRLGF